MKTIRAESIDLGTPTFDSAADAIRYTQGLSCEQIGDVVADSVTYSRESVEFQCRNGAYVMITATASGPVLEITPISTIKADPNPEPVNINFGSASGLWDRPAMCSRLMGRCLVKWQRVGDYLYLYARGLPAIGFTSVRSIDSGGLLLFWCIDPD